MATGSLFAAAGVALGAFGAHGLEDWLTERAEDPLRGLENWNTATRYLMYHALGMLVVGLSSFQLGPTRSLSIAGYLFAIGILVFSGCLYVLALTDLKILGAIVPLGGVSLIAGWLTLAISLMFKGQHD